MTCYSREKANTFGFIGFRRVEDGATLSDLPTIDVCPILLFLYIPTLYLSPISPTEIKINWIDTNLNVTGFEIERSDNGGAFSLIHTALSTDTSYNDTGLSTGDTFVYRIRTVNGLDKSLYSNEVSFELLLSVFEGDGTINTTGIIYVNDTINP